MGSGRVGGLELSRLEEEELLFLNNHHPVRQEHVELHILTVLMHIKQNCEHGACVHVPQVAKSLHL